MALFSLLFFFSWVTVDFLKNFQDMTENTYFLGFIAWQAYKRTREGKRVSHGGGRCLHLH